MESKKMKFKSQPFKLLHKRSQENARAISLCVARGLEALAVLQGKDMSTVVCEQYPLATPERRRALLKYLENLALHDFFDRTLN
jgi:hypothetical protein